MFADANIIPSVSHIYVSIPQEKTVTRLNICSAPVVDKQSGPAPLRDFVALAEITDIVAKNI